MTGSRNDQGTGKHPRKDTIEPYPHTEASSGQQQGGERTDRAHSGSKPGQSQSSGESESLKEREYRDEQGNIHHHTKTYMDQHDKK